VRATSRRRTASSRRAVADRRAREWSERSRQEILGLWPQFALGSSVADRNTTVAGDRSGLHAGRREPDR